MAMKHYVGHRGISHSTVKVGQQYYSTNYKGFPYYLGTTSLYRLSMSILEDSYKRVFIYHQMAPGKPGIPLFVMSSR